MYDCPYCNRPLTLTGVCSNIMCNKKINLIFDVDTLQECVNSSSSKGNQRKWYDFKNKLYIKEQLSYQGLRWNDYKVEVSSGIIGSVLNTEIPIVRQSPCIIVSGGEKTYGVVSKDFREGNEDINFITVKRMMQREHLVFPEDDFPYRKFEFVLELYKRCTGLDVTEYLIVMTILDFLTGNEDRHLNNFGVLEIGENYALAPLFDFGLGWFEHDKRYLNRDLNKCITLMRCKPFHDEPEAIINVLKSNEDYSKILNRVIPKSVSKTALVYPSEIAMQYFQYACEVLGIALI